MFFPMPAQCSAEMTPLVCDCAAQLAAKSVTTIRLQGGDQLTPRSRASESTYRLTAAHDDGPSLAAVAAAAAGISSYNMFARHQKTPRRYWRC